jgi:hypothetical protein
MIGRMIRAFGADDVATLISAKFRKLRFLMIANITATPSAMRELGRLICGVCGELYMVDSRASRRSSRLTMPGDKD